MKHVCRFLAFLLTACMLMSAACAQTTEAVIATVNGEDLLYSSYVAIESAYLYQYQMAGLDVTNPTIAGYVQDLALTYAIEQMLVVQDARAQGFYELDAETEAWCVEQGQAAYEQALKDVGEMLRESLGLVEGADVQKYALDYAQSMNVSVDTYIDEFRKQYAYARYQEWLIRENPVTDADVQAAYDERVGQSEAAHAHDVAAFETAFYAGEEAWYMPEGYRLVQLLTLDAAAQGDTDEAKLASVAEKVDEIRARLANGDAFDSLYGLYSADENPVVTPYQIHRESIIYEDALISGAFSDSMAAPGDCCPVVLGDAVVLLYYQGDATPGPIGMTEEIVDALSYVIYTERTQAALTARIDELADAAVVVIH